MRPRIRTVKPELWQDEKIGDLSLGARLLFVGMITMADDEGRFRATASVILGHVFPYDDEAPRRLKAWVAEIKDSGLVVFYVVDGKPYGAFRHWKRHQRVNRPTDSTLPPPPDPGVARDNSVNEHGSFTDSSVNDHGEVTEDSVIAHSSPRRRAFRSDTDPVVVAFEYWQGRCAKPRAKLTDERRKKVGARLEQGYSLDDIKLGIDGAATNPPRDRDSGVTHDDLVSVCRNGAQLERYMGRAAAKPAGQVVPIASGKFSQYDRAAGL